MQKGNCLHINCQKCSSDVIFSLFSLQQNLHRISCSSCNTTYQLSDENLLRQLKKFEDLIRQIHESEEILSMTTVGVDINQHSVKIPFRLLLTRLNSSIDLLLGDKPLKISFRIEPARDLPVS